MCDFQVLFDRHVEERPRDLVGAPNSGPGALGSGQPGDVAAVERDGSAARRERSADEADQRRLARAIRSDDAGDRAGQEREIDIIDGDDPAEAFDDARNFEERRVHASARPSDGQTRGAGEPDNAPRREADENDQNDAGDGDVRLGIVGQRLAKGDDEDCADQGPEPGADAADDDHRQNVDRPRQAEHAVRLDRAELHRLNGAGHGGERARQHEGRKLHPERAHAHLRRRVLVIANGTQDHGSPGADAKGDRKRRDGGDGERIAKENGQRRRIVLEKEPGRAAEDGDIDHDQSQEFRQRQRPNREIEAAQPEERGRHQRGEGGPGERADDERRRQRQIQSVQKTVGDISAEPDETGGPERDEAGRARHQVPALGQGQVDESPEAEFEAVVADKSRGEP